MFMLVQIQRSKVHGGITGKVFVEDAITTIDQARDIADENGPGEYWVLSHSRHPGNRVVSKFRVGTPREARRMTYA